MSTICFKQMAHLNLDTVYIKNPLCNLVASDGKKAYCVVTQYFHKFFKDYPTKYIVFCIQLYANKAPLRLRTAPLNVQGLSAVCINWLHFYPHFQPDDVDNVLSIVASVVIL